MRYAFDLAWQSVVRTVDETEQTRAEPGVKVDDFRYFACRSALIVRKLHHSMTRARQRRQRCDIANKVVRLRLESPPLGLHKAWQWQPWLILLMSENGPRKTALRNWKLGATNASIGLKATRLSAVYRDR